ncbi:MAG TPA: hypothetical protein VMF91_23980 [Bryobacteraceae bacterium]|nr:hypothetical protein [Bryobacteraceae bacterium]
MKFISRLRRVPSYSSLAWYDSRTVPGVRFATKRISLGQRLELTRNVRELALRYEFLKAGEPGDQLEASLADLLVRKLYIEWGVAELEGLQIDGEKATPAMLIANGPERLSDELIERIRAELELSDEERKNF